MPSVRPRGGDDVRRLRILIYQDVPAALPPIRIVSIDGGGIRGLVPALVLQRLASEIASVRATNGQAAAPLAEQFDLIAGTSAGALIAAGLAGRRDWDTPLATVDELVHFFTHDAAQAFGTPRRWAGLLRPRHAADRLYAAIAQICGDARLSNASTNILVPSFDLDAREAFLFRGGPACQGAPDFFLRDVLCAATAAPTLLPPARITALGEPRVRSYTDGGVFASSPALLAYLEAQRLFGTQRDVIVVSLGTGRTLPPLGDDRTRDWGLLRWLDPRAGAPLIEILLHSQADSVHRSMQQLLPDRLSYLRLDADTTGVGLPAVDDASPGAIAALTRVAEALIAAEAGWIAEIARRLVAG